MKILQQTAPAMIGVTDWLGVRATLEQSEMLAGQDKSLLVWLAEYAHTHQKSKSELARELGINPSTISRLLAGNYGANSDKMMEKVGLYKLQEEARSQAFAAPDFIMTLQAERVHHACDTARLEGVVIPVIGKTHIGKTWALKHYAKTSPMVVYVEAPVPCNLGSLMRLIAKALGVNPVGRADEITDRIQRRLTRNHVLIVDEVHQATRRSKTTASNVLEWLRLELYDKTKCGLILSGTEEFGLAFSEGALSGMMAQLAERTQGYVLRLDTSPRRQDVAAIWTHYGLPDPDEGSEEMGILAYLSKERGMAALTASFSAASRDATDAGGVLTWARFKRVYNDRSQKL